MEIFDPIAGFYFNPLIVIGLGLFAGLMAGMVGLGGGLILVPAMILYGVAPNVAAATANCFMVSTSSSGLYAYMAGRNVNVKTGACLVCGSMLGGMAGVPLVNELLRSGMADGVIRTCFAAITGTVGLFMLWDVFRTGKGSRQGDGGKLQWTKSTIAMIVLVGMAAGLASSILGIAGGVFIVPFLIYFLGFETRMAVGTSLMHILFTTAGVSIFHSYQNKNLDMVLAFFLMIGSGAGAQMGAYLSKKSSPRAIKFIFGLMAVAGSWRLLWGHVYRKAGAVHQLREYPEILREAMRFIEGRPLAYGALSVCLALGIGLFWGRIFARSSRV
ncbi:MAG: sulfite exporter TauE/SafE family protein [Nitrospinae bacterium]|nr:sulfite exporter TauE/SafE family protein [Nitrospinota bacterium]